MLLAEAKLPLVILPGNHDPATPDSIWMRGRFDEIGNVAILGITNERSITFLNLDLEIWGNAHRDYHDMPPLRDPPPRAMRWHIAMGHGHYEPPETWHNPLRPSWLISDAMIDATQADYVALGHWDRAAQVGSGAVPAYYSGSPDYVHTVNLARDDDLALGGQPHEIDRVHIIGRARIIAARCRPIIRARPIMCTRSISCG